MEFFLAAVFMKDSEEREKKLKEFRASFTQSYLSLDLQIFVLFQIEFDGITNVQHNRRQRPAVL